MPMPIFLRRVVPMTFIVACSGGGAVGVDEQGRYETLFDAPSGGTTANEVLGLWGGRSPFDANAELRWRIDETRMSMALRCQVAGAPSVTVGISVAARVADGEMTALESKSDAKKRSDGRDCSVRLTPDTLRYVVRGTTLTLTDDTGQSLKLTKLSD